MTSRFRFEAILQLRRRERDQNALELAGIEAAIAQISARRQQLAGQRETLRHSRNRLSAGIISAHQLKSQADFDRALSYEDDQLQEKAQQLRAEHQQSHDRLIMAHQEVAKLEKLQQRHHTNLQAADRVSQQLQLDEIVAARRTI